MTIGGEVLAHTNHRRLTKTPGMTLHSLLAGSMYFAESILQTNETYESTQIDAFFESKPKIDAFLKIDANAQRQEYKMASLHQRFWKQDAVFFHLTISLFSEQAIHHTQPSAAVSGNPCYRHCQPAAFLSRLHKEAPYQHPAS